MDYVGSSLIFFKLFIEHRPTFDEKLVQCHRFHGDLHSKTFKMAESKDEICADFYESLTQESLVEMAQKKHDFAEIGEDDVSNKPTSSKKQKAEKSGGKSVAKSKKWTDKEIDKLLEMLEDRVCLWDVSSKEYHLRDKRAKAYKEMEEKLGVKAAEIKSKIVGLRAQLGREMVKVRARKSGMALSEVYESNWIYWDRLQFLTKVMEACKSKDKLTWFCRNLSHC